MQSQRLTQTGLRSGDFCVVPAPPPLGCEPACCGVGARTTCEACSDGWTGAEVTVVGAGFGTRYGENVLCTDCVPVGDEVRSLVTVADDAGCTEELC